MVGVIFLVLGVAYGFLGAKLGWPGSPMVWLGLSCGVVGAAFLLNEPRLMGKRLDGTFNGGFFLLLAPFFAATWLAWRLRRYRREPCWAEIVPGLFLGRLALPDELPPGTELVVDLTCELAEPRVIRQKNYRCLPTLDGFAPDQQQFVSLVREIAAHPKPVFIHCAAGHGRSATLAAAVLLARGSVGDLAGAEALLRLRRPGVRFSAAQRRLLVQTTVASSGAGL